MKLKRLLSFFGHFLIRAAGVVLLFIVVTNIVVHLSARPHIYKTVEEVPEAQTVLVPGAAVFSDGTLSSFLEDRVDSAIDLYRAKKVAKILVSGDNSTVAHNEVNPVRDYLLLKGVPDGDIYLDHAGFDTYSTMYRARDIFQVSSVVIVTQEFHLPRAVFIARSLGLEAVGFTADTGRVSLMNYVREIFANEKAAVNLIFGREPKFLGEVIPITEDKIIPPAPLPGEGESTETKTANGFIAGSVSIGPFCPVEREDEPCKAPPEAYTSREVIIYTSNGATVKERGNLDTEGNYKMALPPGNYFVQIEPAGIGPGEKKPATVKSKEITTVDFDIDTGIR
jgi:SanA protein